MKKVILCIIGVFVFVLIYNYQANTGTAMAEEPFEISGGSTDILPHYTEDDLSTPVNLESDTTVEEELPSIFIDGKPMPSEIFEQSDTNPFEICEIKGIEPEAREGRLIMVECKLKSSPPRNNLGAIVGFSVIKEVERHEYIGIDPSKYERIAANPRNILFVDYRISDSETVGKERINYRMRFQHEGLDHVSNVFSVCKERVGLMLCPEEVSPSPKGEEEVAPDEEELDTVAESEEEEVPTLPLGAKGGCSLNSEVKVGSLGLLAIVMLLAISPLAVVKIRRKK